MRGLGKHGRNPWAGDPEGLPEYGRTGRPAGRGGRMGTAFRPLSRPSPPRCRPAARQSSWRGARPRAAPAGRRICSPTARPGRQRGCGAAARSSGGCCARSARSGRKCIPGHGFAQGGVIPGRAQSGGTDALLVVAAGVGQHSPCTQCPAWSSSSAAQPGCPCSSAGTRWHTCGFRKSP